MWQLIENKQKFISQIMTSKAPVRSCEDVDEAALSYAEVKALATGNPAVKEKMSLDVEVAKLKLLKANHLNNVYRMEADISRNLPQKIAKLTEIIEGYREDIAHYEAHKITDPEAFEMEIGGKIFTEKKEAGAALLAVCKQIQSVNEATTSWIIILRFIKKIIILFTAQKCFQVIHWTGCMSDSISTGQEILPGILCQWEILSL